MGIKNRPEISYIAGIVAYIANTITFHNHTNIGKILGSDFDYAGGIVARFIGGYISASCNSGIVAGAKNSVGGIVGWLIDARLEGCISTNWIDIGTAQNYGAIVGMNNGTLTNNYYDNQMCILGGINNQDIQGQAEGLPTTSMLGSSLQNFLPIIWLFENNLYPRIIYDSEHPISLLSAAPIYLQNNPLTGDPERLDNVTQSFSVSNGYAYPPPFNPYYYPYWWGWFNPNYVPFSANGFIEIQQSNNALIRIRGGWDTLSVRLDYPNYGNNGFYTGYNIIFEKQIPVYLGR